MYGLDILCGTSKGTFEIPHKLSYPYIPFEIPHKISYPYTERYDLMMLKIRFTSSYAFFKCSQYSYII